MKRIFWLAILLAAAAGVWALLRPAPVPVDVAEVGKGDIRAFVEDEGETRVSDRFVVAAPVQGRLLRVDLEEGDAVEKGAVVATIDPLPIESRVEETEARVRALQRRLEGVERKLPKTEELERARLREKSAAEDLGIAEQEVEEAAAALDRAEKDLARVRELAGKATATEAEMDAALSEERQARARATAARLRLRVRRLDMGVARLDTRILEERRGDYDWEKADYGEQIRALEASLKALRDDARRTEVVAPCDGTVLVVHQESERVVAAGTPILELGDPRRLEVEADFLSEDVALMEVGMAAEIFGRALGDRIVPARIRRIHPSAFTKISSLGVEQQRVTVVFGFGENEGVALGDRFRVEVRVILDGRRDAVLVPEGALFREGDAWAAFRVLDGSARLTPVRTGLRDGLVREVLEGLSPGDRVILHPDASLGDGAAVAELE